MLGDLVHIARLVSTVKSIMSSPCLGFHFFVLLGLANIFSFCYEFAAHMPRARNSAEKYDVMNLR